MAKMNIQGCVAYLLSVVVMATIVPSVADAHSMQDERNCLALTMYWEARGEGHRGMTAVGWTVLNRVRSKHFPSTPCGVAFEGGEQRGCQFSYWCDGKSDRPRNRHDWNKALIIAAGLMVDPPGDPTHGALFYHSTSIKVPWKRKRVRTTRIGRHIFYR